MYNCIPTNMLESPPVDFLDKDHETQGDWLFYFLQT